MTEIATGRKIDKTPLTDKELRQRLKAVAEGAEKPTAFRVYGADGKGLTLDPATSPAKWYVKWKENGAQKKRYLGTYPKLTLKQARETTAFFWAHGKQLPKDMTPEQSGQKKTIADLWEAFVNDQVGIQWQYDKAKAIKLSYGKNHIFPWVGAKQIEEVQVQDVIDMMNAAPSKNCQQRRKQLLGAFFVWAKDKGHTELEVFPTSAESIRRRVKPAPLQPRNRNSLPWRKVPHFISELVRGGFSLDTPGRQVLLFSALTASRGQPVRFAEWGEVHPVDAFNPETQADMTVPAWTCPFEHMKANHKLSTPVPGKRDHVVPLSRQAEALLNLLRGMAPKESTLIFPSPFTHKPVSDMTANIFIRRMNKMAEAAGGEGYRDTEQDGGVFTPHGFRASFQTWSFETGRSQIAAEACLAHKNTGQDTQGGAYNRSNLLLQKQKLLQDWADFCMSECPPDWCRKAGA